MDTKNIKVRTEDDEITELDGVELNLGEISLCIGENFILAKDSDSLEELEGAYWDIEEFKEDPNLVFGAIFGLITSESSNAELKDDGMYFEADCGDGIKFIYPSVMNEAILQGFALEINGNHTFIDANRFGKDAVSSFKNLLQKVSEKNG
jgi:hypothetical protein